MKVDVHSINSLNDQIRGWKIKLLSPFCRFFESVGEGGLDRFGNSRNLNGKK